MEKENSFKLQGIEEDKVISVIVPTLNAEKNLPDMIDALKQQKDANGVEYWSAIEVIIIDSMSNDRTIEIAQQSGLRIISVKRESYDHGGTRNIAWKAAKGKFIFFLTQDAIPADESYLDSMIKFFSVNGDQLVMVTGRQIPYPDARPSERLTRKFNYPEQSNIRTRESIKEMGIKAFFFSDSCAAYRRSFLEQIGGFEEPILTNEDMLMARRTLEKGYKVGYCASAKVYHSHNFTLKQQYKRNFDISVFLTMYHDEVGVSGVEGEGLRMILYSELELLKGHQFGAMAYCILESFAKLLGNRAGKRYAKMTLPQILKRTSNPTYWRKSGV